MFNFSFGFPKVISADSAACTPIDRRVLRVVTRVAQKWGGNPSSIHMGGVGANKTLTSARKKIADLIFAQPDEIIFTSSGTESNNLAILGVARDYQQKNKKVGTIVTIATEHKSVLEPIQQLEKEGWTANILPVNKAGQITVGDLKVDDLAGVALISISIANNEIGTLHPVKEIVRLARLARKNNNSAYPLVHIDACQAPRFLALDVRKLGADLITINSSKIYGPKGTAILYKTRSVELLPIVYGGGQEQGLRSGTQNVAGAVGLAIALEICFKNQTTEAEEMKKLQTRFINEAQKHLPTIIFHGDLDNRLPNKINFTLPGYDAEWLCLWLDSKGIEASTGSACSHNFSNDNHVLAALYGENMPKEGSIRLSFGRNVSQKDIAKIIKVLKEIPTP
ncbi:MAG: Cysteine desulfurase [Patescibacteria group bacterium]|nr:Cysteine desulfurase [Patescibacteria group bacterium]